MGISVLRSRCVSVRLQWGEINLIQSGARSAQRMLAPNNKFDQAGVGAVAALPISHCGMYSLPPPKQNERQEDTINCITAHVV
jgi:hypothetical protein